MTTQPETPDQYIAQLPKDRQVAMQKLRQVFQANLPEGFMETISYGMIGYVVPHLLYPAGYHVNPKLPLPFISIASQKNNVAIYHMGLYSDEDLLDWFKAEYPKHSKTKLDMGKSCVRFKKIDQIPYELVGELAQKMSPEQWIAVYEGKLKR
ncbi:DUF1801 domain-containing protein [Persicitalea sp.]|uniref:DUF1801 domain-containing protein n=1 Tax=Persicitalea sp. TaxID=3100273 RepID=UPI003593DFBC